MSWNKRVLSDCVQFIDGDRGKNYPRKQDLLETGSCLFLDTGNVTKSGFDFTDKVFISGEKDHQLRKGKLQREDVVLTTRGTLGNVGFFSDSVPFESIRINSGMLILRAKDELNSGYLYYWLQGPQARGQIQGAKTGSAQPQLPVKTLSRFRVEYPNLDTQKRIVDVLAKYDALIENNRKQIKLLEEAAQRLYKEWFIDLRFPGHEDAETDPETGLPEGWLPDWPIGDLVERLESGKRPKGGIDKSLVSGIPSIGAENVLGVGRYNYASEKLIPVEYFENMRKGIVHDRDVLVYKDGAYTGRVSLVQDGFPYSKCAVNEHVFLVSSKSDSDQHWLYFTLERESIFDAIQKVAISSAQPGINQDDFRSIKTLIPTEDLRRHFSDTVSHLVSQIILLAKQSRAAEIARNRLLPRLMEGEIEL